MRERKHFFKIQPFNYEIEIIITDNIDCSRKAYDEYIGHSLEYVPGTTGLHSYNYHYPKSIIFIREKCDFKTIAHESFHAVAAMYRFYDTPLKNATEEVYAYTLDYIIEQVLTFKKAKK